MNELKIKSVGGAVPSKVFTNEAFAGMMDTSDEWIYSRTGIRSRNFCAEGESVSTLAVAAAAQALERSGITADRIGCCICATLSSDYATPSIACRIQKELGLPENVPAFDLNAACSGFVYALVAARGLMMQTGSRYALIVGAEQLSKLLDMSDRSTAVLFGDGAGAAVVELINKEGMYANADMAADGMPESVSELKADDLTGSSASAIRGTDAVDSADGTAFAWTLGARGSMAINTAGPGPEPSHIQMDGKEVFRFAVKIIPECMDKLLKTAGMKLEDIDWVVCHQANSRIIDHVIKQLKVDGSRFFKNMDHAGNTSAASIPMALNEMYEKGLLKSGQKLICVGFGGGLTWGGILLEMS